MDPQKRNKFVLAKIAQVDAPNFSMNWGDLKAYLPINDISVKRVYYIDSAKNQMVTGQHCHKDNEEEVFLVLAGSATALIDEDGNGKKEIAIEKNSIMWVPRMVWHGFTNLSADFVIMALTTTNYDPERRGYVTDYEEFKKMVKEDKK